MAPNMISKGKSRARSWFLHPCADTRTQYGSDLFPSATTRAWLTLDLQTRGALILAFLLLSSLFFFKSYPSQGSPSGGPYHTTHDEDTFASNHRIAKVSMLYGEKLNPYYVRALRTHRVHNERWNYGMHVLEQDLTGSYWNKPSYLMHLIVKELAKPPADRLEWIMWVDADLVLVNPAVPLEVFLPPPDFKDVKFMGNRDHHGLNSGTFFLKVDPWAIRMLSTALALPLFRPDLDLDVSVDQTAMAVMMNETDFSGNGEVLFQPRTWYNNFQFHANVGEEWVDGDLLIHFPGLEEDRWPLMERWLDRVEQHPKDRELPVEKTKYPNETRQFWDLVREARRWLEKAEKRLEELGGDTPDKPEEWHQLQIARHVLQRTMQGTEYPTRPGLNLFDVYRENIDAVVGILEPSKVGSND